MSNSFKVAVRQRQSRYVRVFALLFLAAFASSRAWAAWEEGMAHIVVLQGQYMPNLVSFTADTGTASCPAGTWLSYGSASTQSTNQAIYAMVLAALNTGNKVLYFITAGDTTCTVQILYEYGTS
jgi:hypothetical protein